MNRRRPSEAWGSFLRRLADPQLRPYEIALARLVLAALAAKLGVDVEQLVR